MVREVAIEVLDLTKKFGRITALNHIDFQIFKGEIFGLIGPNGAGKSTFISILTTLLKPTDGDVLVYSESVTGNPEYVKRIIGYVPQDIALYPMLSTRDNLNFWAGIYGLTGKTRKQRVEEALHIARLSDRADDRVDNLSGGMKRRLNIAVSLLHRPEILVMDEPTVGVDITSRKCIMDAVKKIKDSGCTVIMTSHNLDEMETLCDRAAILDRGEIRAVGTLEDLKSRYRCSHLEDILLMLVKGESL